jgi:heat shock protein HtpX
VQALVKFAGGHDPGPIALPSDAGPGDQPVPPVPSGPWSDPKDQAQDQAGVSPDAPPGPWGNRTGPWGRRG